MKSEARAGDAGLGALKSIPQRRSLGQHVYENLKQAIVKGELPPGSRCVESRAAGILGISRTPVREALHKLEREGLLRHSPAGGFFVTGLTREDIEETFGIRGVLEGYAARLAAVKHEGRELEPLEEKIREYQACLDRGELDALPRINTDFHELLYALSRSPRLIRMIADLGDWIHRFRRVILKSRKLAEVSNRDHRLLLAHIRRRDAEGAETRVREHILRGQEAVLKEFDAQRVR